MNHTQLRTEGFNTQFANMVMGFEEDQPAPQASSHEVGRQFVIAGKAIFTVCNTKTGNRYTYRVSKGDIRPGYERFGEPYFVGLLTGPQNDTDYSYVGMLNPDTGYVKLTAKSKLNLNSVPYRVLARACGSLWNGSRLPDGWTIHHEGKCGRCGRTLTVPSSIESGFGPECADRMGL